MSERTPGVWVFDGAGSVVARMDGRDIALIASTRREANNCLSFAYPEEEAVNGRYLAAGPALANCLREMFGLIERGELVRDVSNDAKGNHHIKMMILVGILHRAHTLLKALGFRVEDAATPLADNFRGDA